MKKNFFTAFTLLIALYACSPVQQSISYVVEGELQDSSSNGKMIYILRYDDNKLIDSTKVDGNKFAFTGKVDTASFCRIDATQREYTNFILENGNIKVNFIKPNQPSGTLQNDEMAKLSIEEDSIYAHMSRKRKELQANYPDGNEFREQWKAYFDEWKIKLGTRSIELYKMHGNDAVGSYLLYTVFMKDPESNVKEMIISGLGPWLKSSQMVQRMISLLEAQKKTAEGLPFTDIKGKDMNGNPISLSDFIGRGNYVLIDMWSSWCGPCKDEIPNLAKLHNKYNKKGLTVLGMFVWDEEENLKEAMEKEKITWPQIIDSEETAMKLYGVNGIPHIILFAPDGTILKRNLRGENMIRTIDEIMNKK